MKIKGFGWKPDLPDKRDIHYSVTKKSPPKLVDLRNIDVPIYDQGDLGSCTANAIAAHLDFNRKKQGESLITPSRLFIYYNERLLEGTVDSDAGATIRESVKVVTKQGAAPESEWGYDISQFAVEPPKNVYTDALKFQSLQYQRLAQTLGAFRSCLATGYPFVGGITVYNSFHNADVGGMVPVPSLNDTVEGGHAIMFVGYDDSQKHFIVRNSWGTGWGDKGYFYLPYDYLLDPNLASDFWSLRKVE